MSRGFPTAHEVFILWRCTTWNIGLASMCVIRLWCSVLVAKSNSLSRIQEIENERRLVSTLWAHALFICNFPLVKWPAVSVCFLALVSIVSISLCIFVCDSIPKNWFSSEPRPPPQIQEFHTSLGVLFLQKSHRSKQRKTTNRDLVARSARIFIFHSDPQTVHKLNTACASPLSLFRV